MALRVSRPLRLALLHLRSHIQQSKAYSGFKTIPRDVGTNGTPKRHVDIQERASQLAGKHFMILASPLPNSLSAICIKGNRSAVISAHSCWFQKEADVSTWTMHRSCIVCLWRIQDPQIDIVIGIDDAIRGEDA